MSSQDKLPNYYFNFSIRMSISCNATRMLNVCLPHTFCIRNQSDKAAITLVWLSFQVDVSSLGFIWIYQLKFSQVLNFILYMYKSRPFFLVSNWFAQNFTSPDVLVYIVETWMKGRGLEFQTSHLSWPLTGLWTSWMAQKIETCVRTTCNALVWRSPRSWWKNVIIPMMSNIECCSYVLVWTNGSESAILIWVRWHKSSSLTICIHLTDLRNK